MKHTFALAAFLSISNLAYAHAHGKNGHNADDADTPESHAVAICDKAVINTVTRLHLPLVDGARVFSPQNSLATIRNGGTHFQTSQPVLIVNNDLQVPDDLYTSGRPAEQVKPDIQISAKNMRVCVIW